MIIINESKNVFSFSLLQDPDSFSVGDYSIVYRLSKFRIFIANVLSLFGKSYKYYITLKDGSKFRLTTERFDGAVTIFEIVKCG